MNKITTVKDQPAINGGDIPVHVTGSDYQYDGWLSSVFTKRSGAIRYVVEDANGRLFIHNSKQLGVDEGWMSDVLPDAKSDAQTMGKGTR